MRTFNGYPDSFGAKRVSVFPHAGPTSYTVITEGVAPLLATGGDLVTAIEAGMKYFDGVITLGVDSGKYFVQVIPTTPSGVIATPTALPQPGTTARLKWMVAATGAEAGAVDLSAEIVRLFAVGPQ